MQNLQNTEEAIQPADTDDEREVEPTVPTTEEARKATDSEPSDEANTTANATGTKPQRKERLATDSVVVDTKAAGENEEERTKTTTTTECKSPGEEGPCLYQSLCEGYNYEPHLKFWTVDNEATAFWEKYGQKIACKNLWISVGNLTLAFAVWLIWSIIAVMLQDSYEFSCLNANSSECYYSFSGWKENMDLATYKSTTLILPATAGLSGATLRLTNTFMIAPCGGRITISQCSILLLLPMILLCIALNDTNVSFTTLIVIAWLTGSGGGAFSCSMSNISQFYPKRKQGLALALNAGIGNLGVSLMQFLVPWVVEVPFFGKGASVYIGHVGYIANSALVWIPLLCIFIVLAWLFMNSLPQHSNAQYVLKALVSFYWLEAIGYIAAGVCVLILIGTRSFMVDGLRIIQAFILWIIAVVITILMMKYLLFFSYLETTRKNLAKRFEIFQMKHTWIMAYLYTMTFGSFIGFSATFPSLIRTLYPDVNEYYYAWLGPFVGSIFRPPGGLLSDKVGGARVTHWTIVIMILLVFAVGFVVEFGNEDLFPLFLILFLLLFIATGIGNASTFRMVPIIFKKKENAGPVLGWIGAIAAYGAFVVPIIFGTSITGGIVEWVFFIFAIWYASCLVLNWWFYYRANAEIKC